MYFRTKKPKIPKSLYTTKFMVEIELVVKMVRERSYIRSMLSEFQDNMLDGNPEYQDTMISQGYSFHIYYQDGTYVYLHGTEDLNNIKNVSKHGIYNIIYFDSESSMDFFNDDLTDEDPIEWVHDQDYMREWNEKNKLLGPYYWVTRWDMK